MLDMESFKAKIKEKQGYIFNVCNGKLFRKQLDELRSLHINSRNYEAVGEVKYN